MGRYALQSELGRGGMGTVWRAADAELERVVALKSLLPGGDAGLFVREAQITAQLEHPNIVPVHDVGLTDGAEPFFTMKVVGGRTFSQVIREGGTVRSLLEILLRVCDATAFAHARGVVHRDLKPANVMVGEFGEVLVMDWGLAQVGDAPEADAAVRVEKLEETLGGEVVGTLSYMPPEQARGEPVDARADVYALGAMLYQVLAGAPPVTGKTVLELLEKARAGEIAPLPAGAPPELSAIARKSLAGDPAGRYATASELRADLRRYLQAREVSARRDPLMTRALKWVRRNPVASAAAAAALAALIGGIGLARAQAEAARRARLAQLLSERTLESCWGALELEPENAEARALVEQISTSRRQAEVEAKARPREAAAEALLSQVPPMSEERDVRRRAIELLLGVEAHLRVAQELRGTPPARRVEAASLLGEWALSGKDYALARMAYSIAGSTEIVDREEVAEENRRAARIEQALDELANPPAVSGVEPSKQRAMYLADWIYEVVGYREAQTARMLGEALGSYIGKAKREGREVRWTQPQREVLKFCFEVLGRIERPESVGPLAAMMEVIRDREVELVVGCGLALCNTRDARAEGPLLAARDRLGVNSEEWRQIARSFARVPEPEGAPEPVTAAEFTKRGLARKARGNLAGAIQDYSRAIELDPKYAGAFNNRAIARQARGDLEGAIEDYSRAIELDPKVAMTFNNRGLARRAQGDLAGAIEDHSRAIELHPEDAAAFNNRGLARSDRGDLLAMSERLEEARVEWAGAIEDYSRAIGLDPKVAMAFNNRGIARQARGDLEGAIEDYSRAIDLDPKLVMAFKNRGNARSDRRDIGGAIEDYSLAIELDPQDAPTFYNRGNARKARADLAGAIEDYSRAIDLEPKLAMAFNNRGNARRARGDPAGAIEDYSRAIELNPKYAATFYNRGIARQDRGDLAGAIEDHSRAIDLDPKHAAAFANRGFGRQARGDIAGAIADWRRFLDLAPDHPNAPAVRAALEAARLRLSEQEDY